MSGRLSRAAFVGLAIALLVGGGVVVARPAQSDRISILDVGQGDAILVEGARGGRLLIDGGPDPDRLLVALDRRVPPWDRRIDVVILSHPHEDHVAGLALLLERYRVGRVFEPGMRGPGPGYSAWARRLGTALGPPRRTLATGDRLTVDDISMRVLWPSAGSVPLEPPDGGTAINNVSVVLLGQIGPRRFLLMGDVEEGIDPSMHRGGIAPRRPAQGRSPRQPNRNDRLVRGRGPPEGRRRVGRGRESVRSPGQGHARSPCRRRGTGPSDRPRWHGRRRFRGGRHDGPDGGTARGRGGGGTAGQARRRPGHRLSMRDPGHRARARGRASAVDISRPPVGIERPPPDRSAAGRRVPSRR